MIYDPGIDSATLLAEHRRWAELHCRLPAEPPRHEYDADPNRPLRVGYVSPDFRSHAVAYFLEPILTHHRRDQVESYCYADVGAPDGKTAQLRGLAAQWRDIFGMSTAQVVRRVREDRIDILVELAGHTADNRLLVFAQKPAPVQVSYLGYPCTTGLPAIDYRLGDAVTDPPADSPAYTEELVRLPGAFCCYAPPQNAPDIVPPPADRHGTITFGSLHKIEKLNAVVWDLWSEILRAVLSARLLVGRSTLQDSTTAYLRDQLSGRGIDPARLTFGRPLSANLQHLRMYDDIDIALDPFPWNGHTSACEALWMGVPVVALRGQRHSGRMVASILTCLELTELIAATPGDYCRIAVALAADASRRAALRVQLRGRMLASPLCDGAAFTRNLEAVYRQMWRRLVGSG
jgi:predicted O-linked N-acetylglucosamine transferase (SPINDLY family)